MTPAVAEPPKAKRVKPKMRGVSHVFAFVAALGGVFFLAIAPVSGMRFVANLLYGGSLVMLFGVSGLYHRPMWGTAARARLRRLDHSSIAVLIAGTYTPMAVLDSNGVWTLGLTIMWGSAVAIIAVAVLFSHAPRQLRAGLYVAQGFLAAPVVMKLHALVGLNRVLLLVAGAAIYILGAIVYARRWPNPKPTVFGYHEVFHLMVVTAAAVQYGVLLDLQYRPT